MKIFTPSRFAKTLTFAAVLALGAISTAQASTMSGAKNLVAPMHAYIPTNAATTDIGGSVILIGGRHRHGGGHHSGHHGRHHSGHYGGHHRYHRRHGHRHRSDWDYVGAGLLGMAIGGAIANSRNNCDRYRASNGRYYCR